MTIHLEDPSTAVAQRKLLTVLGLLHLGKPMDAAVAARGLADSLCSCISDSDAQELHHFVTFDFATKTYTVQEAS